MFKRLVSVSLLVMMASSGFAADMQLETVVASVDGQAITKDDLYTAFIQSYPNQANETINRLVNDILIEKEANAKKVMVTDKEIQDKAKELGLTGEMTRAIKQVVKSSLLLEKMIIAEKKLSVTSDEVKTFFDTNKEKLAKPEQVRIRQLAVKNEAQAKDLEIAIKAGADFAKLVEARSEDEQTKAKGGDLGYFSKGMLTPEIEKIVFSLKPGEVSPVIPTSAGYLIIKVDEKTEGKPAKFDNQMKKDLKQAILNSKVQQESSAFIDNLRKNAVIK